MTRQSSWSAVLLFALFSLGVSAQTSAAEKAAQHQTDLSVPVKPGAKPRAQERESRGGMGMMRGAGTSGTITDIKDGVFVIKSLDGKTATVKTTSETRYIKERQPAQAKDFKVGDVLMVRGEQSSDGNWTGLALISSADMAARMKAMQEKLGKEFIAGEVKSIEDATLTILRIDGQTQIIEADENTSFQRKGESITLADIKAGEHVSGPGELKNGVFVAKVLHVGIAPSGMMAPAPPMQHQSAPPK